MPGMAFIDSKVYTQWAFSVGPRVPWPERPGDHQKSWKTYAKQAPGVVWVVWISENLKTGAVEAAECHLDPRVCTWSWWWPFEAEGLWPCDGKAQISGKRVDLEA